MTTEQARQLDGRELSVRSRTELVLLLGAAGAASSSRSAGIDEALDRSIVEEEP